MRSKKIAVIIGSLRKESFSRKTAKALIALAPESLALEIIEIGGLPIYNQDLEEPPPNAWTDFRERLKNFDGFLFVTPEYNRSVPAVPEERDRRRFPPVRKKYMGWKAGRHRECFTGRAWSVRCKPSFEAVAGVSQRFDHGSA